MSEQTSGGKRASRTVWLLVGAGVAIFCAANAHLVYVAVNSQPACVAHLKQPQPGSGLFRAAKSDC